MTVLGPMNYNTNDWLRTHRVGYQPSPRELNLSYVHLWEESQKPDFKWDREHSTPTAAVTGFGGTRTLRILQAGYNERIWLRRSAPLHSGSL